MHSKRIIAIAIIGISLVAIPLVVYQSRQTQDIRQRAATSLTQPAKDTCNMTSISVKEAPACPVLASWSPGGQISPTPGGTNNVASYSATYTVTNTTTSTKTITYTAPSFFCTSPYGDATGPNLNCLQNGQNTDTKIATLAAGGTMDIVVSRGSPTQTACGTYQTDFTIQSIDGNTSCTYGVGPSSPGSASLCMTGTTCPAITPTATPAPTCIQPQPVKNVKVTCPFCKS